MARKRTGLSDPGSGGYPCGKCGVPMLSTEQDLRHPGIWVGPQVVYHCEGALHVFRSRFRNEPHHYRSTWGACWKCGRAIGCLLCSGTEEQVLCENWREHGDLGAVWATKKGFLKNGPLVRQREHGRLQGLIDYPPAWAIEYEPLEVTSEQARQILDRLIAKLMPKMSMPDPDPQDFDQ